MLIRFNLLTVCLIMIFMYSIPNTASGQVVTAQSGVNLIAGPFVVRAENADTTVISEAFGTGATAFASASSKGILKVGTTNANALPINNSSSSAGYNSTFSIQGNSSQLKIPLTFNFNLNGSLTATSQSPLPESFSNATFSWQVIFPVFSGGGGHLASSAGMPILISGDHSSLWARVNPVAEFDVTVPLNEGDIDDLNLNFAFEAPLGEYDLPASQGIIANAINVIGLPRLNILPGTAVDIGFDVEFYYNKPVNLSTDIVNSGSMWMTIASGAQSTTFGSSATSIYSNTFELKSITVPHDYNQINPDSLIIHFGSNYSVQVSQATLDEISIIDLDSLETGFFVLEASEAALKIFLNNDSDGGSIKVTKQPQTFAGNIFSGLASSSDSTVIAPDTIIHHSCFNFKTEELSDLGYIFLNDYSSDSIATSLLSKSIFVIQTDTSSAWHAVNTYRFGNMLKSDSLMETGNFKIALATNSAHIPVMIEPANPNNIIEEIRLLQNYPNPFNASTIIKYTLSRKTHVVIEIYDIVGKRIKNINMGEQGSGAHHLHFNASHLASGIYFYRLRTSRQERIMKMVLMK